MTEEMISKAKTQLWIEEPCNGVYGQRYLLSETLFSGHSKFQKVDVVQSVGFGKMLFLDGLVMLSERDEFVYHDMIAHVPLFIHPNPRSVLIIGGGDGGTAREVLRHKSVEKAVMVEIDGMVVDVSKKFIPQTSCALDDPRLTLMIDDGVKYMAETNETFDVVLIDSTDPIGPAKPLFGDSFYKNVARVLNDNGIVVSQGESIFYEKEAQQTILRSISNNFAVTSLYNYHNLTYPGGMWSFAFGSKGLHPLKDFDEARVAASDLEFSYYSSDVHRGAFALPQFQQDALDEFLKS